MPASDHSFEVKLDNVLVATDFSSASKEAVLYATAIARRHNSKLYIAHVVTSRSESALMDGWRAGQAEIIEQLLANRLDGIKHELLVKSGEISEVLSQLIAEEGIDLVVVGTRGRTGVLKLLLGSVAENIFRRALCPVLTVGPNIAGQNPEIGPERILAATGFAAHSFFSAAVRDSTGLRLSSRKRCRRLRASGRVPPALAVLTIRRRRWPRSASSARFVVTECVRQRVADRWSRTLLRWISHRFRPWADCRTAADRGGCA